MEGATHGFVFSELVGQFRCFPGLFDLLADALSSSNCKVSGHVRSIHCIPRLSTTTLLPLSSNYWTYAGCVPGTRSVLVSPQPHSQPPPWQNSGSRTPATRADDRTGTWLSPCSPIT